ncbi:TonB-dependent receptor plug domain-containing protein [Pelosinus sp. sgz500959]|uniref:TonB-dependent receptor plug domain-containing protein n=1 Tax=Pelosinus sp. sgz500959 TaxID=3242472 RepID=UPI00366DA730
MKHKLLSKMICTALAAGLLLPSVCAEASETFSLDQIIVTALKIESKDLETPAYVTVYTEEQLKGTGAANILEALRYTEGIIYHSMGPGGQSWAGMTSKAVMRGSEKGTLVLINGVKINMDGYYNLEDIPVQNVERVEIVKGAASVLYGADAFGGVINVITKKDIKNSITYSQGNFGQKNHSLSLQDGKFNITAVEQKIGLVKGLSDTGYGTGGSDKNSFQWSYKVSDQLTFTHEHVENEYSFDKYSGTTSNINWNVKTQSSLYDDVKDYARLHYDGDKWDINVYTNVQDREYNKYTGLNTSKVHSNSEKYKFSEYGIDAQTNWETSFATFLGGIGYSRENYRKKVMLPIASAVNFNESRDGYSMFLQGSKKVSEDTTVILGVRQEYVKNNSDTLSAFCPQLQVLKKLEENKTWYINAGKSFKMPGFNQLYDTAGTISGANADLKPEEGWNYETGLKWEGKDSSIKVAVFNMDYDAIKYVNHGTNADPYYIPENIPFRNTGIEMSYQKQLNKAFSYVVGASYGNPEIYSGNQWISQYGRVQFNTSLKYQYDRWTSNLTASYLGDRAYTDKPQLPVNLTVAYAMDQNKTINLSIDNLLDRRDINTHSTTPYYALPRSYRLGYTQQF